MFIFPYCLFTRNRCSKYASSLRSLQSQVQNIRKEYFILRDLYSNDIQSWRLYLQTIDKSLEKGNEINQNNLYFE